MPPVDCLPPAADRPDASGGAPLPPCPADPAGGPRCAPRATAPAWLAALCRADAQPVLHAGMWRLHPDEYSQFFAEYLPASFFATLAQAGELGWREAVTAGLAALRPDLAAYTRDYFLAPYRAAFVDRLGLRPGDPVFDIGCGWGFASQRALELGARVVGAEAARARLDFCRQRFAQEGFADRFVGVEFDANRAWPFRPGSFAAILVSGLLEWLPCSSGDDPDAVQARFLARCRAALRPGGRLYLAIENRTWHAYFRLAPDLHTHQRLLPLLPRRLARMLSLLRSGRDYRAYCATAFGYLQMFRTAGFASVAIDHPRPDYVQPRTVAPLLDPTPLAGPWGDLRRAVVRRCRDRWALLFARSFQFHLTA